VLIEVGPDVDAALLAPGAPLELAGLDTPAPTLRLGGRGAAGGGEGGEGGGGGAPPLVGAYEHSFGSVLLLEAAPPGGEAGSGGGARCVAVTDRLLRFGLRRPS